MIAHCEILFCKSWIDQKEYDYVKDLMECVCVVCVFKEASI